MAGRHDYKSWHASTRYNPQRADISPHCRVAGLRRLCHHPVILAAYPSSRALLALAAGFSISHPDTVLDCHVDSGWGGHREVARPVAVRHAVELAACRLALRRRSVDLPALRSRFQRRPARWPSRTHSRTSRTAPHHFGHTRPGPPSGLSGAFMRDAGLEPGDRVGGLLRADRVRGDHRRHHDPAGRSESWSSGSARNTASIGGGCRLSCPGKIYSGTVDSGSSRSTSSWEGRTGKEAWQKCNICY